MNYFEFFNLTILDFCSVSKTIARHLVQKKFCEFTMENADVLSNTKNQLYATIIGTIWAENVLTSVLIRSEKCENCAQCFQNCIKNIEVSVLWSNVYLKTVSWPHFNCVLIPRFTLFIIANLILLNHGCIVGWFSPALPILLSENTPLLTGPLSNEELSWVSSMSSIGAICGTFIFGFISSQIGPKRAMTLLAFPAITYWILVRFGNTFYYLLIARFITGWTVGKTKAFIRNFRSFWYWYSEFCRWNAIWRCAICFGNCEWQVNAIKRDDDIY